MAGDVMTTATVGAEAARIGDTSEFLEEARGDTDQATATRPDSGAPARQAQEPPKPEEPKEPE